MPFDGPSLLQNKIDGVPDGFKMFTDRVAAIPMQNLQRPRSLLRGDTDGRAAVRDMLTPVDLRRYDERDWFTPESHGLPLRPLQADRDRRVRIPPTPAKPMDTRNG